MPFAASTAASSVSPVLELDTGHLLKVSQVSGDQPRPVGQGDASDQQILRADFL
jgi:hypothetical protein